MSISIYHNPRCSKSRAALALLASKTQDYTVLDYLKNPITAAELTDLLQKLNMKPVDLLRKNEAVYKDLIKGKNLTDRQLIETMVAQPKLIERPIIVNGAKAVIGRPAEKLLEVL